MLSSVCGVEFQMCDAYIDQGRKIGNDGVGFKCTKIAETQVNIDGVLRSVCMVHRAMIDDETGRVSFDGGI